MIGNFLARKNLLSDRFATVCMVLGVALGTATVNVVLALDSNTRRVESTEWSTNPDLTAESAQTTIGLIPQPKNGPLNTLDPTKETHEDYQVMRSAIRLGSLSAFLVGALIVFFSLAVVIERRKREVALLRSLGASRRQIAGVFVREALWVGIIGAIVGFVLSVPLTWMAAAAGITTTGRSRIGWIWFPWRDMIAVSSIGALTALLGVIPPVRQILRLDVTQTLRPGFLESKHERPPRTSGTTLIVLPFSLLLYGLMRPFFREVLPSLAFFVLEAGLVVLALLGLLVLVPDLTRFIGGLIGRAVVRGPRAARLLIVRRVEKQGHEMAWSVGGVMLVFALLLSLHISTHALKQEVVRFGERATRRYAFVYSQYDTVLSPAALAGLDPAVKVARFSGRTPWPNAVLAVRHDELLEVARATGRENATAIAAKLDDKSVILSTLMARRLGLVEGDALTLASTDRSRTLQVVAVTDDVGFVPVIGPYRNGKTYALIDAANFDLIQPFAHDLGAALVLADPRGEADWKAIFRALPRRNALIKQSGEAFEALRIEETDRDFVVFDVILALTTLLAAVGIANQLVLAVHGRRREIALLRVLGMTASQIQTMLLFEGAFVGLLGGGLAVVLGLPLGYGSLAALRVVSAFDVRFELPPEYVFITIGAAVVLAMAAALHPARQAAAARSAESVHYE